MGKRADLLIVGARDSLEYAYGEGSRIQDEAAIKNVMDEKLKTNNTMKDMLCVLQDQVHGDAKSLLPKTVGYQCSSKVKVNSPGINDLTVYFRV